MSSNNIILLIAGLVGIGGGLLLLREAKKYRHRRYSAKQCDHDWQPDGQTMTAVRWTCVKCGKTKLNGLDLDNL